jgi:uncharacterized protein (TIGR00255 family)
VSHASPIYSMTGYATAQGATAASGAQSAIAPSTTLEPVAFTLTVKSVNHRFLDLQLRLPGDCDALELPLRKLVKDKIKRGHVELTLYVERRTREANTAVRLDRELLAACIRAFHEAAETHSLGGEPDLNELLRLPGVLTPETAASGSRSVSGVDGSALDAAVLALAPKLLDDYNQGRAIEGAALAAELRASMQRLRMLAEESASLRSGARQAHFERLRLRIRELLQADASSELSGTETAQPSDHRLMAEAALLVERSDVEEELVRLRTHIDSFLAILDAGGELGKRLDFLLQELNREANTMLSKTSGADAAAGLRLTSLGLEMKAEIERVREQVQNLE